MGSWGDLFPAIGLAAAARARGHDVVIAATESYRPLIEAEGVTAVATGPRFGPAEFAADPAILDGRQGGFAGFLHLFQTQVFPNLDTWVGELRQALAGADLLVTHPTLLPAPIAAEASGVPWAAFSVFPGLIPSRHVWPMPTRLAPPGGRVTQAACQMVWTATRLNIRRHFDPPVNAARATVGLPAVRDSLFLPVRSAERYLLLADPAVISRAPDWPASIRMTGPVDWDQPTATPTPPEVAQFLDAGQPPVLVTLGASSSVDPQGFYPAAVAAVRGLGHRVLVLTGPTPEPVDLPPDPEVCCVPFAPLAEIAHRCTAGIHHGGVGTTSLLLAAGVPQLIVPRGFDQPQTARRMERLGVARSLPWRHAGTLRIRTSLEELLADERLRKHAEHVADRLREAGGANRAVDELDALLGD